MRGMASSSFQKRLEAVALWLRSLARASAVAGCIAAVVGFAAYPRPYGTNSGPQKMFAYGAVELAMLTGLASLVLGSLAAGTCMDKTISRQRPLWPYMLLNFVSLLAATGLPGT
jgi:hypothetical protein